jgi:hypothetical protein
MAAPTWENTTRRLASVAPSVPAVFRRLFPPAVQRPASPCSLPFLSMKCRETVIVRVSISTSASSIMHAE